MITNINSDTISMAPQMCNNILNLKVSVRVLSLKRTGTCGENKNLLVRVLYCMMAFVFCHSSFPKTEV